MTRPLLLVASLTLMTWSSVTLADALRCGNRLVYEGDATALVESRCGKPAQINRSSMLKIPTFWHNGRLYQLSDQEVLVPVETWIYNFGPSKFMRKLRFEDGVLMDIEVLDYGY